MSRQPSSASRRTSTLQSELELIPEYNDPGCSRLPAIHPGGLRQHTESPRSKRSLDKYARSSKLLSGRSEAADLFLPELGLPRSSLARILQNRNKYIQGYFNSIEDARYRHVREQFAKVVVGDWVVRGTLEGNYLFLRGANDA